MSNVIQVRYGETLNMTVNLGSSFSGLNTLKFFVGDVGRNRPLLTASAAVTGETASIAIPKVRVPVGKHYYHLTATFLDGTVEKYPAGLSGIDLPEFIVGDSLDETEI